jgi:alpha-mannosidase
MPLAVVPAGTGTGPDSASVVRADRANVTIEAVKKADEGDAVVVRLSEAWGARGRVHLSTSLPLASAERVDLLERGGKAVPCKGGIVALDLRPFELVTLKLELAR